MYTDKQLELSSFPAREIFQSGLQDGYCRCHSIVHDLPPRAAVLCFDYTIRRYTTEMATTYRNHNMPPMLSTCANSENVHPKHARHAQDNANANAKHQHEITGKTSTRRKNRTTCCKTQIECNIGVISR